MNEIDSIVFSSRALWQAQENLCKAILNVGGYDTVVSRMSGLSIPVVARIRRDPEYRPFDIRLVPHPRSEAPLADELRRLSQ